MKADTIDIKFNYCEGRTKLGKPCSYKAKYTCMSCGLKVCGRHRSKNYKRCWYHWPQV